MSNISTLVGLRFILLFVGVEDTQKKNLAGKLLKLKNGDFEMLKGNQSDTKKVKNEYPVEPFEINDCQQFCVNGVKESKQPNPNPNRTFETSQCSNPNPARRTPDRARR